MKISKRYLRRIIKEEKARLLVEFRVEEGISRGFHEGIRNWIDEEIAASGGSLSLQDPVVAQSLIHALSKIVREIKDERRGPTR